MKFKKVIDAFILFIFISLINISIAASEQKILAYQCLLANRPIIPVLHMAPPSKPILMTYAEPVKPYLDTSCQATKLVQEVYQRLNARYKTTNHFHEKAKAIAQKKYEAEIAVWEVSQKKYEEHIAEYQTQLGVYIAVKQLYDDQLSRLSQSVAFGQAVRK